jgi:hypothetical protein
VVEEDKAKWLAVPGRAQVDLCHFANKFNSVAYLFHYREEVVGIYHVIGTDVGCLFRGRLRLSRGRGDNCCGRNVPGGKEVF